MDGPSIAACWSRSPRRLRGQRRIAPGLSPFTGALMHGSGGSAAVPQRWRRVIRAAWPAPSGVPFVVLGSACTQLESTTVG